MKESTLQKSASQWIAGLDAALTSVMSTGESNALIREVFASFLLLRWVDLQEAEQEAMAAFEDRLYQPLLPVSLQWRQWIQLDNPQEITDRLQDLLRYVEGLRGDATHSLAAYLHTLAEPLRRVLKVNFVYLHDFVRWVAELPFETPSERRRVRELFDWTISETGDLYDGQFTTPVNIARLVAALANPKPGESVYDPCFGFGTFLLAAWEHAEQSGNELRRPGALLDLAGMEIHDGAFLIGLTRMLLDGIERPRLEQGSCLERESLSSPIRQGFDVVLANPPIGVKTSRESGRLQHFAIATNDTTGLFVQHVLSQLKPQGRAVIIVPEGFLFRGGGERELRRYLLEQGQVEAVVGLPAGAFAPYISIKCCLLVLSKPGGMKSIQMVDASPLFERRSKGSELSISPGNVEVLVSSLRQHQTGNSKSWATAGVMAAAAGVMAGTLPSAMAVAAGPVGLVVGGIAGLATAALSKKKLGIWSATAEELEIADWDLSPRRREKGGLDALLSSLSEALGDSGSVAPLSSVAQVIAGRSIKSADLLDESPLENSVGYIRIKDLNQGKVSRTSRWLRPEQASAEKRWALLPGDVLVSKSGTIGKAALVRNGAVGAIAANGLYVLRANQERLDAGFLLAYLASPACQNWLSAQSRGSVIQHLNRAALDELPIPLPPLQMQARAAAQFREFGTDALTFLTQATGSNDADRLISWLAELDGKVPKFVSGLDNTPALSQFEPIMALVITAKRLLDQEHVSSQSARWLVPLTQALLPLDGVAQIPPGPGLLNVLQDAEHALQATMEQITSYLPTESQARAVCERIQEWLRAAISDLIDTNGLTVRKSPASLVSGGFAEFSVELENPGVLPLRNLHVETQPDWGSVELPYLAERGVFAINLRGDVPKQGSNLSLRLQWRARALSGQAVEGEIELVLRVSEPQQTSGAGLVELGGSPYVTGSPLDPVHGHSVFYGRDELIGKISRQIATHGNVVLLEGNRRAGKTSILKHLEGRSAIPGWLAVYASLQGAEGAAQVVGVPTAEVFREIARSIATALAKLNIEVPLPNGQTLAAGKPALGVARACREGIGADSPFIDFREYLELVLTVLEPLGLGLVLMLDEFDKLQEGIDNGVTSPQVPENIRFLIQTYPKFSAILTGSRRLKRLREEYWSALYGLGTNIPVTALDTQSARKVVVEPVRDQLAFSQEAIERVIDVTARQPYLMQCLCNRVFDYAVQTKSRAITAGVVNDAALGLVRDNEHFASLWDYAALGPETGRHRRQLILLLCALSFKQGTHISFGTLHEQLAQVGVDAADEALDADLSYLRELELIEFSGEIGDGEYRLAIPLMADWIEQQQDADVVTSRARTEAEEENA